MITPIKTMTINQIMERKDDLLISDEDIKEVARNVRNKAIEKFAEKLKETLNTYIEDAKDEGDYTYIEPFEISKRAVKEVAEQLKEGEKYDN